MRIVALIISVPIMYVLMCIILNTYFKSNLKFPKSLFLQDKKGIIMSAAASLITAAAFVIGKNIGIYEGILYYIMAVLLACIAVIDFKTKIIPNKFVLCLLILWVICTGAMCIISIEEGITVLVKSITGFVFSMLVFGTGYLFMKNKLGGGDVKLGLVLGLILTSDIIFGALIYSFVLSFLFALVGIIIKKLKIKDTISFAPFIFIGTISAIAVMQR